MKKSFLLLSIVLLSFIVMSFQCGKDRWIYDDDEVYTARFEIVGICTNYTFTVIRGDINPSLVESSWTDPQTKITYTNAFGISNPCDLPSNLKKGDTFRFVIKTPNKDDRCNVCLAYYPTPNKKLNIKVVN